MLEDYGMYGIEHCRRKWKSWLCHVVVLLYSYAT